MARPLFTVSLPSDVLNCLLKAGFKTTEDLINNQSEPSSEVVNILKSTGFSWNNFLDSIAPVEKISGGQLFKEEKDIETIATFSEALDDILGGGIPVGQLIQICGPPGSGKTQLVIQLCLDVQIPISMGGLNSSAVFIDSERGFTKHRFKEMAEATISHCKCLGEMYNLTEEIANFTVDSIVDGVKYIDVTGHIELMAVIELLHEYIPQNRIKLVVIDSIVKPLLAVQNTLDRTRYLTRIIKQLQKYAHQYSLAVVLINDLTTWISSNGDKTLIPSLGETISHLSPTVLILARYDNYFSAQIYKSSYLPQRSANFMVQNEGIRDLKTCENVVA